MKIMITGGLGHIGSALIQILARREIRRQHSLSNLIEAEDFPGTPTIITVLDNLRTQRYPVLFDLPKGVQFIEADVRGDLRPHFENQDIVIHLAAITDAASSHELGDVVYDVNQNGTWSVVHACMGHGCKLIFPSTTSVYGVQDPNVDVDLLDENSRLLPQNPYAESKVIAEQIISSTGSLNYVIFRFGTIFGPSMGMRFHTAINSFIWNAVQGKPIEVWKGAQSQWRPYLDLIDACRVIEFAIDNELFERELYNAVTLNLTVNQVIEAISQVLPGSDSLVEYVEHELLNQLSYHVSADKIKDKGFKFSGNLRHGIVGTVRFLHALGGAKG